MTENLLRNGGFEADWGDEKSHRCHVFPSGEIRDIGNIFVPPGGWVFWFYHEPGKYDQPEGRDAWGQNDPHRVKSGKKAYMWFTFYRNHDAGLYQRVAVTPGTQLRFTAWMHSWSNGLSEADGGHLHDGRWSDGAPLVGYKEVAILLGDAPPLSGDPQNDAIGNFTFQVGIDPTGSINPLASSVVWGDAYHIYNGYVQELSVEAIAQADTVTVFARSMTLWPFVHNDSYIDDAALVVVGEQPPDEEPPPEEPDEPDEESRGLPREQYARTYVLLPPDEPVETAREVINLTWDHQRWTLGGSADDSGIGNLDDRRVIALNPQGWANADAPQGLTQGWYDEHYPGYEDDPDDPSVVFWPLEYETVYQLRGRLLAYALKEDGFRLGYPTTNDQERVTSEFGALENFRNGVDHCGLDLASSAAVWGDEVLSATDGVVVEAGWQNNQGAFGYRVRVKTQAPNGDDLFVRYAHLVKGSIAVAVGDEIQRGDVLGESGSTGKSTADHLHIDVFYPKFARYCDPALLIEWPGQAEPDEPEPPPVEVLTPLIGFNDPDDQGAGGWLVDNGAHGAPDEPAAVLCVPLFTQGRQQISLDFSDLLAAGVHVIVNLRYSWARDDGGGGTFPTSVNTHKFVDVCTSTILAARGVAGWSLGNEPNNPREWPGADEPITPQRVASVFNQVAARVGDAILAPAAIDPFNGSYMRPRQYFHEVWAHVSGADFVDVHGYLRGPEAGLCWSDGEFETLPGHGLNYLRCVTDLLEELMGQEHERLPVIVTEFNHYWKTEEGDYGWVDDERAAQVVEAAYRRAVEWNEAGNLHQIAGLCLYRWQGDDWETYRNEHVQRAVREILRRE